MPGKPIHTAAPNNMVLSILGVAIFLLYAATAQRVVGFEDSVGFTTSCLYGDIAHAPGYPLYSLLCHPFAQLPTASPAYAAALFSATCAAAAVLVLARILYLLSNDAITAVGGAALFGVSRSFWSQATIAEVYTLNALLFFVAFLLLLQWWKQPTIKRFILVVFISSLALTNHWPLFLLAALGFLPFLWQRRVWLIQQLKQPRSLLLSAAALCAGLLPYIYLYWRANNPEAFVRLPAAPQDFLSLWQVISREVLLPALDNPAGSQWQDKFAFMAFLGKQVLTNEISLLGGGLAIVGFIRQWRDIGVAPAVSLCLLFLGATLGLVLLLNFLYDEVGKQTFAPYPLLPYAAACIWAALAVRYLFKQWRGAVLTAICLYALFLNYQVNDRRQDTQAIDIADAYLEALPPGAFFPLRPLYNLLVYRQYVFDKRPDVYLFPAPNPYLAETITPGKKLYSPNVLSFDEEMEIVNTYAANNPVCYNTFIPFSPVFLSQEHLLFSCFRDDKTPAVRTDERVNNFLRRLAMDYENSDDWQMRKISGRILTDATRTLMLVRSHLALPPSWGDLLEELSATPPGQLAVMEFLVKQPGLTVSAERVGLFERTARKNLPKLNRRQRARLLSALADSFAAISPRDEKSLSSASRYHRQAASIIPAADAPAVQAAFRFYQREQLLEDLAGLKLKYGAALLTADVGKIEE